MHTGRSNPTLFVSLFLLKRTRCFTSMLHKIPKPTSSSLPLSSNCWILSLQQASNNAELGWNQDKKISTDHVSITNNNCSSFGVWIKVTLHKMLTSHEKLKWNTLWTSEWVVTITVHNLNIYATNIHIAKGRNFMIKTSSTTIKMFQWTIHFHFPMNIPDQLCISNTWKLSCCLLETIKWFYYYRPNNYYTLKLFLIPFSVFLNSPNLNPYFSLNKFERIWLLIFSSWLCLINSHFLITKCQILYVLYKEKLVVDNLLALKGLNQLTPLKQPKQ